MIPDVIRMFSGVIPGKRSTKRQETHVLQTKRRKEIDKHGGPIAELYRWVHGFTRKVLREQF